MHQVIDRLDAVSNDLENRGYVKEAQQIDVISNTVELMLEAGSKPDGSPGDTKGRSRPNPVFDHTSPDVLDDNDHFPINTAGRARNALARANQYSESPKWFDGSLEELKKRVADTVKKAYPDIDVTEESYE